MNRLQYIIKVLKLSFLIIWFFYANITSAIGNIIINDSLLIAPIVPMATSCTWEFNGTMKDMDFAGAFGYMVGTGGAVYRTDNAGVSWQRIIVSTENFTDVDVFNSQLILIGGDKNIWKTEDGGSTWTRMMESNRTLSSSAINVVNASTYYLADGDLKKTSDGGKTWKLLLHTLSDTYTRSIEAIKATGSVSYARWYSLNSSDRSGIFSSTNDWASYSDVTILNEEAPLNPILSDVVFTSETVAFATGRFGFLKSADGGITWNNLSPYYGGGRLQYQSGVLTAFGLDIKNTISRTQNEGASWDARTLPTSEAISPTNVVYFFDNQNGILALQNRDYQTSSTIVYKTSDGGQNWNPITPEPMVSEVNTACFGLTQDFAAPDIYDATYKWTVAGGIIEGSNSNNQVKVKWTDVGSNSIELSIFFQTCGVTVMHNVAVNQTVPHVTATGAGTICNSDTTAVELISNQASSTFRWNAAVIAGKSNGQSSGTGNVIHEKLVTTEGATVRYFITTDQCNTDTITFDVVVHPTPIAHVTQSGNDLLASCSNCIAATYQWYLNDDPISGATGKQFSAESGGKYTVTINDDINCESLHSNEIDVVSSIENDKLNKSFTVYPIPVSGSSIFVRTTDDSSNCVYKILAQDGRILAKGTFLKNSTDFTKELSVENLDAGFYIIEVVTDKKILRSHIIKVK